MADRLIVRGAREHNLKDVSLDLPRDALIVFTGLSGSGKSSLAFDTIFAEGQRRYVESPVGVRPAVPRPDGQARRRLHRGAVPGRLDRPEVHLPQPALDGRHDHRGLRLPAAALRPDRRAALPGLRRADRPADPAADRRPGARAGARAPGSRCSRPVVRGRKGEYVELFAELQSKGYARARVDGVRGRASPSRRSSRSRRSTRSRWSSTGSSVKASAKRRLTDSVETALGLSGGAGGARLRRPARGRPAPRADLLRAPRLPDDDLSFEELEPRSFSFNAPYGACPECTGLGTRMEVDPELLVPDAGAVAARRRDRAVGRHGSTSRLLPAAARRARPTPLGFRLDTPWAKLPAKAAQDAVLHGHDDQVHVRYRNRYGRERSYYTGVRGRDPVRPAPARRGRERLAAGSGSRATCARCRARPATATRLKPIVLAVTIGGRSIAEVCLAADRRVRRASSAALELTDRETQIAERVLKEINARLRLPARRRPGLPHPRPGRRHPRRRRGAADPARHPDRLRPGRRALRPRRAVASGCTSATTTG